MSDAVVVALISGLCTLVGSFTGVLASQRLTNFRLTALEKEVAKHNQVIERTYKIEGRMDEVEHEVHDLKKYHQPR